VFCVIVMPSDLARHETVVVPDVGTALVAPVRAAAEKVKVTTTSLASSDRPIKKVPL
jgi:hypothetical protein